MKEPVLNGPSTVEFFINDKKVGEMDITATVYGAYTGHETFDIGRDEGLPVNEEYEHLGKFQFTPGQLHKVVFDISNPEEQDVSAAAVTGAISKCFFKTVEFKIPVFVNKYLPIAHHKIQPGCTIFAHIFSGPWPISSNPNCSPSCGQG